MHTWAHVEIFVGKPKKGSPHEKKPPSPIRRRRRPPAVFFQRRGRAVAFAPPPTGAMHAHKVFVGFYLTFTNPLRCPLTN